MSFQPLRLGYRTAQLSRTLLGLGVVSESVSVSISGVSTAAQVGSVVSSGSAKTFLTGLEAQGQPGTVGFTASAVASPSGVQTTKGLGASTEQASAVVASPGEHATFSAGTVTAGSVTSALISGVHGTAELGLVGATASVITSVQGLEITGQEGSVLAGTITFALISGVETDGNVGVLSAKGTANIGLGSVLTTSQAGIASGVPITRAAISGVASTHELGETDETGTADFTPDGAQITPHLGDITVSTSSHGTVDVGVQGLGTSGSVGTLRVSISAVARPFGVAFVGHADQAGFTGSAVAHPAGVQTLSHLGTVTVVASSPATAPISGVSTTGQVGDPAGNFVTASGVQTTSGVGFLRVSSTNNYRLTNGLSFASLNSSTTKFRIIQ